jgi:peptide/nickel transport system substrate-binding protein
MSIDRRTALKGAGALAASAFLSKTAFSQSAGAALRFIPSTPLPSLDPITATSYVIRNHGYLIYDTLFATDANFQIKPQMVEAWETAPDGLKWTFRLRDGLVFHDDQPVTSKDCIASIARWSKRDAFGQTFATFVEGYQVIDQRTFSIALKKPFPMMTAALGKLSSNVPFIMPERVALTDHLKNISEPIGSGPWRFMDKQWVPGQNAIYERFAAYKPREEAPSWAAGGKVAKINRIEWVALTEPGAAVGALTKGEVDWYEQPPVDLLPVLKANKDVTIENVPLGLFLLMRFNQMQPPFNNPAIRRAVMMAVNQTDYMEAVVGDAAYYKEAKTFLTPGAPMSTGAGGAEAMQGNLEKAKAMLKEAGYKGEKVVLLAPADQPIAYQQCMVTEDLFKKLGINSELVATDWASFIGRRANRGLPEQGGWSCFHTLWSCADTLNPALHPLIRANGGSAWFGWPDDPQIESLRDQWIAEPDLGKQKEIAASLERRAFEFVPYVPAGLVQQPMAYRKSLTGMVLSPVQFFWNMEKKV